MYSRQVPPISTARHRLALLSPLSTVNAACIAITAALQVQGAGSSCLSTAHVPDLCCVLCRDCAQAPPPPPQGLEVLAFPCNQFGGQEPKSNAEIKAFAQARGAEYPLFAKVDVNGPNAHPLYKWMKAETLAAFGLIEVPVKWCATPPASWFFCKPRSSTSAAPAAGLAASDDSFSETQKGISRNSQSRGMGWWPSATCPQPLRWQWSRISGSCSKGVLSLIREVQKVGDAV